MGRSRPCGPAGAAGAPAGTARRVLGHVERGGGELGVGPPGLLRVTVQRSEVVATSASSACAAATSHDPHYSHPAPAGRAPAQLAHHSVVLTIHRCGVADGQGVEQNTQLVDRPRVRRFPFHPRPGDHGSKVTSSMSNSIARDRATTVSANNDGALCSRSRACSLGKAVSSRPKSTHHCGASAGSAPSKSSNVPSNSSAIRCFAALVVAERSTSTSACSICRCITLRINASSPSRRSSSATSPAFTAGPPGWSWPTVTGPRPRRSGAVSLRRRGRGRRHPAPGYLHLNRRSRSAGNLPRGVDTTVAAVAGAGALVALPHPHPFRP